MNLLTLGKFLVSLFDLNNPNKPCTRLAILVQGLLVQSGSASQPSTMLGTKQRRFAPIGFVLRHQIYPLTTDH